MSGPERYSFITPVWGDVYVERFLKLSLPSQLSAGNLGAIPRGKGEFLIYTRREHARTILRSPAYRRLKAMMPAAVRSLDDLPDPRLGKNPHELQTAAYTRGIKAGAGAETAFVFLTPDILIGDGTYRNMVRLAEGGKRIHLVAGIRMLAEGAVSCLVQHRLEGRIAVAIPCRGLVRSCLDNLHPISVGHIVDEGGVFAAQHLYWRVGDQGLLARGFHLHPLLVWPRNPDAVIRNTLDDEYVSRACPDREDWHTVTDSDEMCVIEFSDRRHKFDMVGSERLSDATVAAFLHEFTTPDHREHVRHRIRFLAQNPGGREWDAAESESDVLVAKYLDLHARGVPEEGRLGRVEVVHSPAAPRVSSAKFLLRAVVAPLRLANRSINFFQYRYLERLNATILHQQKQLDQAHRQLANLSKMVEEMTERLAQAEEAARSAEIRAADNAVLDRRRRRKAESKSRFGP